MTHAFCSRLAETTHGVIAGTGVRGDIYVFLPVKKRWWGASEFNAGWATPTDIEALKRARRAGVVTRLYDPKVERGAEVLVHRSPSAPSSASAALSELLAGIAHHDWGIEDRQTPRLALCTQGTRDRCCAKWGFPVYRAAQALYEAGRLALAPIECSHLGGDRFAATGILFPSGSMYGHLDKVDLATLAALDAQGGILHANYRGRVFENPIVQIVRAGLARAGEPVTPTSPLAVLNPQDAPGSLEVIASDRRYEVLLARREVQFFADCRSVNRDHLSKEGRLVCEAVRALGPAER